MPVQRRLSHTQFDLSRPLPKLQLSLRIFQRFTGLSWTERVSLGGMMSNGRSCDLGNFSRTRLQTRRLSGPMLQKARSGLVPAFQRPEWKLAVSFGLLKRARMLEFAHVARESLQHCCYYISS